jgi:hypothetical protein
MRKARPSPPAIRMLMCQLTDEKCVDAGPSLCLFVGQFYEDLMHCSKGVPVKTSRKKIEPIAEAAATPSEVRTKSIRRKQ